MVPDASTRRAGLARQNPTSPAGEPRWQVRLLGAVEAFDGVQRLDRFPSRAVAVLLARLALAPDRAHAREELVELLWPGVALAVGRNRLRQVLSTLKSMLEPPGVPGAVVVLADRLSVRAAPAALGCDASRFEQLVRAGQREQAAALYRGELMPGYFDEWVHDERQRLAALHESLVPAPLSRHSITPRTPAAADVRAGSVEPRVLAGHAATTAAATIAATTAATTATTATTTPHLPTYLTRLFGADLAVARLRSQVRAQRLVTLLGPGGSGKTRLAVEVAQALREPGPWVAEAAAPAFDRIAFVPLVSCEQAAQVHAAIVRALQLPTVGADSAEGLGLGLGLALALAGQRVLLVLDNFEQLVGRAEAAVAALLGALPLLHVLVTSRRALGLDGEVSVAAEPLALPAADAPLSGAGANAAVALFVDRARAVRADFHLTVRNHAAVVALVRSLQGMPLAIELAASRVRSFSPADMVQLLGAGDAAHLALLSRSGPRAGHDARHASMAQVIAWSWLLLDAPAQHLMAALTCFAGDASADALAAVLGAPLPTVAARLDDLASHSLLRAVASEETRFGAPVGARFGLVEPVREFVQAQMQAQMAPALRAELQAAVRAWLLRWARALGTAPALARVAPELRTVHAVLASATTAPRETAELTLALRSFWESEGLPAALQAALEQALRLLSPADAALRSELHELLAYLRFEAGFVAEARAHATAALAAAGEQPARRARALVRCAWVELATGRGEDDAGTQTLRLQAWLQEALALAQGCGDREAQARALHQLAVVASQAQSDWAGAEAMLAQSQALWQALGDRRKAYARQRNRAQCWLHLGRTDEALASFELCERAAHEDGDWVGQIDSMLSLSSLLAARRQWAQALDIDRRCVALCWQRWHRHGLGYALWNPPRLLARLRRPEPAMRLMGFAATFWKTQFGPLSRADQQTVRRVTRLVRSQVGAARASALWAEGAAMDIAQAVALAQQG